MTNLILSILFGFLAISCSRSSGTDNTATQDQLPAATQTGANTAGCLVNGKVLLPRGQKIQNGPVLAAQYQFLNGGYHFGIYFDDNSNTESKTPSLSSDNIDLKEGATYNLTQDLNDSSKSYFFGSYFYSNNSAVGITTYTTNQINTGQFTISNLDTTKFIISGTFWFDAVNNKGEKVEVRQGRFDVHYAP
jgi:hypothetical protein